MCGCVGCSEACDSSDCCSADILAMCVCFIYICVCVCVSVLEPFTSEHLVCSEDRFMRPTDSQDGNTVLLYQLSILICLLPTQRCINFCVNKQPVSATHCRAVKASDVKKILQFTNSYNTSKFTVPLSCISLLLAPTCFCLTASTTELTSILLIGCEIHNSGTVHWLTL